MFLYLFSSARVRGFHGNGSRDVYQLLNQSTTLVAFNFCLMMSCAVFLKVRATTTDISDGPRLPVSITTAHVR